MKIRNKYYRYITFTFSFFNYTFYATSTIGEDTWTC